ncbi:FATTY ACID HYDROPEROXIDE LYASE [Salix viminalis]|uniref:FATTY ACID HYDROPEROXIDE LYASE n=1 Tax=Salix viminalis TaxID=40686 RepID=A0A9Q0QJL5_SALVM|nr:FATTY ACID HYDROPEROXIDE LYASE [Salix viminalis]
MSPSSSSSESKLPLKPIPGDYGSPFFGAIKDRLDYFYNQGKDEFFKTRIQKHNSTVIKTNMPPGPFIAKNPKVIAVLDAISFPILFDTSKVEKYNVLDGTFLPSLSFTGGDTEFVPILTLLSPNIPLSNPTSCPCWRPSTVSSFLSLDPACHSFSSASRMA